MKWPKKIAVEENEVGEMALRRGERLPFGFRIYVLAPKRKAKKGTGTGGGSK